VEHEQTTINIHGEYFFLKFLFCHSVSILSSFCSVEVILHCILCTFGKKRNFPTKAGCQLIQISMYFSLTYTKIHLTWGTECIHSQIWVIRAEQAPYKDSNCSPKAVSCTTELTSVIRQTKVLLEKV
jgi:hypothetical protein